VEQGTNTDPIHIIVQDDTNPVQEKTYMDVGVQTMEATGVLTNRIAAINKPMHEEDKTPIIKLENATSTIRESRATKTPYRHPNH
jgi:hypothetical protein